MLPQKKRSTRQFGRVLDVNTTITIAKGPMVNLKKQQTIGKTAKSLQKAKGIENNEPNKGSSIAKCTHEYKPTVAQCNAKEIVAVVHHDATKCLPKPEHDECDNNNNNNVQAAVFQSNGDLKLDDLIIPAEDQLEWIISGDAEKDINYFLLLIRERYAALLETWEQNEKLEEEVEQLNQESSLLAEQVENIAHLRELLFAEEEDQGLQSI